MLPFFTSKCIYFFLYHFLFEPVYLFCIIFVCLINYTLNNCGRGGGFIVKVGKHGQPYWQLFQVNFRPPVISH